MCYLGIWYRKFYDPKILIFVIGLVFLFFFLKNIKYFNTHMGRGENVLKKLTVMLLGLC